MKVTNTSLHYRLASVYGKLDDYASRTNLCEYTAHLFLGVFFWCCAVLVGCIVAYFMILDPAIWVTLCIEEGRLMPPLPQTCAVLTLWAMALSVIASVFWAAYRSPSPCAKRIAAGRIATAPSSKSLSSSPR